MYTMGVIIKDKVAFMVDGPTEKAFFYCGAWYMWERDFFRAFPAAHIIG
jgi:hypothetical protein